MTGFPGTRHRLVHGLLVAGVAMSVAVGGAVDASAGGTEHSRRLTVTYDEDAFLQANRISVTQTFDDPKEFPPEQRAVMFDGVRFWSKDTAPPYWRVGGVEGATVQCPEVCSLYRAFRDGADSEVMTIAFRNHGVVRSFGFELSPFGSPNQFVIKVVEADGRVTPIWLQRDAGTTYLGLHSRIGIRKVVITQRPDKADGVSANFSIDQVSRSYIRSYISSCRHWWTR